MILGLIEAVVIAVCLYGMASSRRNNLIWGLALIIAILVLFFVHCGR